MSLRYLTVLFIGGLFLTGCAKDPVETHDSEDTEGETGNVDETGNLDETDPSVEYQAIAGSINYIYTEYGEVVCNSTTTFTGIGIPPTMGDYSFAITSSVVENEGHSYLCQSDIYFTLDSEAFTAVDQQLILYYTEDYFGVPELCAGGESYCYPITGNDTFLEGSTLNWEIEQASIAEDELLGYHLYGACYEGAWGETDCGFGTDCSPLAELVTGTSNPGVISASTYEEYGSADIWTFSANAGELIQISVDTISLDTWGELSFILNAPDECTIATSAFESLADCSSAPVDYGEGCPSFEIEAPTDGIYSLYVKGWLGDEAQRDIEYSLVARVGDSDVDLTLTSDNGPISADMPYTYDIEGTLTFSE